MMDTILIASIVWVVFLASNIVVGFCMYRLGLHGKIRDYLDNTPVDESPTDRVVESLAGRYIPGSEFNPFETQPPPRYQPENFMPDPVIPGVEGGENNGDGRG